MGPSWETVWGVCVSPCLLGLTIANYDPDHWKRRARMMFATSALAFLFNFTALVSLAFSFNQHRASRRCNDYSDLVGDCIGYEEQSRYLLVQIGQVLLFSLICLALSILTCPYKHPPNSKPGKISWISWLSYIFAHQVQFFSSLSSISSSSCAVSKGGKLLWQLWQLFSFILPQWLAFLVKLTYFELATIY